MRKRDDRSRTTDQGKQSVRVPSGAPAWLTADLIEHTLRVWQPFYSDQLIPEDALEIIMSIGQLVDVLSSGETHETVRRVGSREQP